MGRMFYGNGVSGCWTAGIDNCVVVAVAEYTNGHWGNFWFKHLAGGCYEDFVQQIAHSAPAGPRFAVIAAKYYSGTSVLGDELIRRLGIPSNNISVYLSHQDFAFGVCLVGGSYGGAFGEVTQRGELMPENYPF
jgi:hypothetical protein